MNHQENISEKQAVPAVFLTATPLADSESSHPAVARANQSQQELCMYLLRETTLFRDS
jgi:hypothetical protein